jgi:hypothetical protein
MNRSIAKSSFGLTVVEYFCKYLSMSYFGNGFGDPWFLFLGGSKAPQSSSAYGDGDALAAHLSWSAP